MKIAILGSGRVGGTLGAGLAAAGHDVVFGVRDPDDPKHREAPLRVATVPAAVAASEAVILATPWDAVPAVLATVGDFAGKPLLDATNPIGPGFALTHGHTDSGAEWVARLAPSARVVKAFNSTGFENMADPHYGDRRAAMFVCGDDAAAREVALGLARDLGFDAVAVGALSRARLLEPLAMLWISLAMAPGQGRSLAFGLLRR
jgi:8-hydroxy-5-deazaflavin:NADPH oxidoreductase